MEPFPHPTDRKERKTSRDFVAPTRDQMTTGRFMPAGDSHGVGFKTPTGSFKTKSMKEGPIPLKTECFDPNEI